MGRKLTWNRDPTLALSMMVSSVTDGMKVGALSLTSFRTTVTSMILKKRPREDCAARRSDRRQSRRNLPIKGLVSVHGFRPTR